MSCSPISFDAIPCLRQIRCLFEIRFVGRTSTNLSGIDADEAAHAVNRKTKDAPLAKKHTQNVTMVLPGKETRPDKQYEEVLHIRRRSTMDEDQLNGHCIVGRFSTKSQSSAPGNSTMNEAKRGDHCGIDRFSTKLMPHRRNEANPGEHCTSDRFSTKPWPHRIK